jgi:hypothetical protein
MLRLIRCILAALVIVCLTAGAAQALPVRSDFALPEAGRLLDAAWNWVVNRFRPAEPPAARQDLSQQQKTGCGMDPDGKPKPCTY